MNIYVGNLSWQMTDEDLRTLFEQYGSVTSAKIVKDKTSGRSKGFGFVEMPEDGEAQNAKVSATTNRTPNPIYAIAIGS